MRCGYGKDGEPFGHIMFRFACPVRNLGPVLLGYFAMQMISHCANESRKEAADLRCHLLTNSDLRHQACILWDSDSGGVLSRC